MAKGALAPSGNVVKCSCALVITAKRSVDELFMHYFHNLSSASGAKGAQTSTGALSLDPLGDFYPQTPNLPTPGKNPAGAHGDKLVDRMLASNYKTVAV